MQPAVETAPEQIQVAEIAFMPDMRRQLLHLVECLSMANELGRERNCAFINVSRLLQRHFTKLEKFRALLLDKNLLTLCT